MHIPDILLAHIVDSFELAECSFRSMAKFIRLYIPSFDHVILPLTEAEEYCGHMAVLARERQFRALLNCLRWMMKRGGLLEQGSCVNNVKYCNDQK